MTDTELSLLNLLADIRAAVGDPTGKLMRDELIEHCKKMHVALSVIDHMSDGAYMNHKGCAKGMATINGCAKSALKI